MGSASFDRFWFGLLLRDLGPRELDLQRLWFEHLLPSQFVTTAGDPVEIVQTGWWNHEPGPDFRDAAARIAGTLVHGDIELHLNGTDWDAHGHTADPAFNRLILHVSARGGWPVRLESGRVVPTITLAGQTAEPLASLLEQLPPLAQQAPAARPGPCAAALAHFNDSQLRALLREAGTFRMTQKAGKLSRQWRRDGPVQTLWESIADALGFKENRVPFRLLARRFPVDSFQHRAPLEREALLLGAAGFLPRVETTSWPVANREHATRLWHSFWLRPESLAVPVVPRHLWRLCGTRPANHPQRRLAALAALAPRISAWSERLNHGSLDAIMEELQGLRHPFWDHHATLRSAPVPDSVALIGRSRAIDILFNLALPWRIACGADDLSPWSQFPAELSNRHLEIAHQRLLAPRAPAFRIRTALEQQGLLHLFHDFCRTDTSDCRDCPFPPLVERWRAARCG